MQKKVKNIEKLVLQALVKLCIGMIWRNSNNI